MWDPHWTFPLPLPPSFITSIDALLQAQLGCRVLWCYSHYITSSPLFQGKCVCFQWIHFAQHACLNGNYTFTSVCNSQRHSNSPAIQMSKVAASCGTENTYRFYLEICPVEYFSLHFVYNENMLKWDFLYNSLSPFCGGFWNSQRNLEAPEKQAKLKFILFVQLADKGD